VFARPPARLPKVQVQFASRDRRQLRAGSLVKALDVWEQAELTDRSGRGGRGGDESDAEPVRVTAEGRSATGYEAARLAARSLGLTQSFAWLLGLPGIAQIGQALYPGGQAPTGPAREAVSAGAPTVGSRS
jgi:hypothetical protein